MAIITGITAERMQEYMNENVVTGSINEMGNLILVTRDGTQIDAGSSIPTVPIASDIQAGRVELADDTEAAASTATDKALTPANLKAIPGNRLMQTVRYTSSGIFTKGSFPMAKAIRVRLVGGGGGGGAGRPATTGQHSSGGGGGGGAYAEKWITVASLAATETVTVGAGGAGTSTQGTAGGTTTFGSHCGAGGGGGGNTASAQTVLVIALGGTPGVALSGDLLINGGAGHHGLGYATLGIGGEGGTSQLGGSGMGSGGPSGAGAYPGGVGQGYGGGGGGSAQNQDAAGVTNGANGAPGIVLVDVFA
ncbi:hypothetical protein SEA_GIANTSBANE_24 [Arthrobacter phage Giantsbane]|nr:hypothetical protein SEA_GIANTSBANE_24 [Arthrobacter phage Giantsbane]